MLDQLFADDRQTHQAHVEHQSLRWRNQIVPGQVAGTVLQMPVTKRTDCGVVTMGQRNPGIGRATTGCGNARHYLERNPVGRQLFDFFTATAKDKRIATLEPHTRLPCLARSTSCWLI